VYGGQIVGQAFLALAIDTEARRHGETNERERS
jgi:acyl-CoA thioesterase